MAKSVDAQDLTGTSIRRTVNLVISNGSEGSTPSQGTMNKRYSLVFNPRLIQWIRRKSTARVGLRGNKGADTTPPSSVGCFYEGCLAGF